MSVVLPKDVGRLNPDLAPRGVLVHTLALNGSFSCGSAHFVPSSNSEYSSLRYDEHPFQTYELSVDPGFPLQITSLNAQSLYTHRHTLAQWSQSPRRYEALYFLHSSLGTMQIPPVTRLVSTATAWGGICQTRPKYRSFANLTRPDVDANVQRNHTVYGNVT